MIMENESMQIDIRSGDLKYDYGNSTIPMSAFGIGPEDATLDLEFVVKQVYDEPNGKFSLVFGNAAMIDCTKVFSEFRDAIIIKINLIPEEDPMHQKAMNVLNDATDWILDRGITFCDFAFDIEGVLKDQSSYYLGTYDEIKAGLEPPAIELTDALGLHTNQTLS